MPNPIVHFEIMGSDSAMTQEYYSSLFGWPISSDNPAGYGLALTQDEGVYVSVYAQVDDPQAYLDKAVALGATEIVPVTEVPGMQIVIAMFADPDGNCIGLVMG